MKAIENIGWKWIIAPYEADAQLTYLFKTGKADLICTEDSDLIAYGVTKLLYNLGNDEEGYELDMEGLFYEDDNSDKIRWRTGSIENKLCDIIDVDEDIDHSPKKNSLQFSEGSGLSQSSLKSVCVEKVPIFSKDQFLPLWILAGWDYLEPIKGIGFKTAYKLMERYGSVNRVVEWIVSLRKFNVPKRYLESYQFAIMTFLFQVVYDPDKEIWVHLSDPKTNKSFGNLFLQAENKNFWGEPIPDEFGRDICNGRMDIRTK